MINLIKPSPKLGHTVVVLFLSWAYAFSSSKRSEKRSYLGEIILPAKVCRQSSRARLSRLMSLDPQELLAVRLGSGRVYLIPRAVLENLVHAYPVEACQLIVSASTTRAPLDPSGLPFKVG